jgi:hypothetical protein
MRAIWERPIAAHGKWPPGPGVSAPRQAFRLARTRRCSRRAALAVSATGRDAAEASRTARRGCVGHTVALPAPESSHRADVVGRPCQSKLFRLARKRGVAAVARLPRCRLATPTPPMQAGSCDAAMLPCSRPDGAPDASRCDHGRGGSPASRARVRPLRRLGYAGPWVRVWVLPAARTHPALGALNAAARIAAPAALAPRAPCV